LKSVYVPVLWSVPALATLTALTACSGVRHSTREGASREARAVELVKVSATGIDTPYRIVSFSTWDVDLVDDLPAEAPPDVVDDMREEAAANGAEMLLLERYESDYRKAFYGVGAVPDELAAKEIPTCGHPGFQIAMDKARAAARSCGEALRQRRPQIRGAVVVAFEIDPRGDVLRAAPTPDSSRDSELQGCAIDAVHATPFGVPLQFTCQARLAVEVVGDQAPPPTPAPAP